MSTLILNNGDSFTLASGTSDLNVVGNGSGGSESLIVGAGSNIGLSQFAQDAGDQVLLSGAAGDYEVSASGNTVTLTNGETTVTVPTSDKATSLQFNDTSMDLAIDTNAGAIKLGDQDITETATAITASGDGNGHNDAPGGTPIPGTSDGDTSPEPTGDFTLTESANTVDEGGSVTYTVETKQEITEETTLQLSLQGNDLNGNASSATVGDDVTLGQNNVTFAAGASAGDTVSFTVNAQNDTVVEGLEGFKVSVLDDSFNSIASETAGINDTTEPAGKSFTLQTTSDSLTPNASNADNQTTGSDDTFSAFVESGGDITLNNTDNIDAGDGDDQLDVRITDVGGNNITAAPQLTSVEQIFLRNQDATGSNAYILNASSVTGTNEFWVQNSVATSTTTVTSVADLSTTFGLDNAQGTYNVNFADSAVTGSDDAINVAVTNGSNATLEANDVSGSNDVVEALNIASTGGDANTINTSASGHNEFGTVTVTGDTDLDLGTLENIDATVNAGDFTGNLTVQLDPSAANFTVTGGSGDDRIVTTGTADANDTFDGGAGQDAFVVNDAGAPASDATISNFEVFAVRDTDGTANTLDASSNALSGFDSLEAVAAGNDNDISITKAAGGASFTFAVTSDSDNVFDKTSVALADASGSSDMVNITADNRDSGTVATFANIDATNIETVNLTLERAADLDSADEFTIQAVTGAGSALNIDGEADATFGGNTALTQTTIDASAATGDLTMRLGAADQTVTTGSGDDTFSLGGEGDANDSVDGGDGNDTLTVSGTGAGTTVGTPSTSNVETVVASLGGIGGNDSSSDTITLDASNLSGTEHVVLNETDGGAAVGTASDGTASTGDTATFNVTGLATGQTVDVQGSVNDATPEDTAVLDLDMADASGSDDSLNIDLTPDGGAQTVENITTAATENLTINVDNGDDESAQNATVTDLDVTGAESLTLTSSPDDGLTVSGFSNGGDIADMDLTGVEAGFSIAETGGGTTYALGTISEGIGSNNVASTDTGSGGSVDTAASVLGLSTGEADTLEFSDLSNSLLLSDVEVGGDITDDNFDFSGMSGLSSVDDLTFTSGEFTGDANADTKITSSAFDGEIVVDNVGVTEFNDADFAFA